MNKFIYGQKIHETTQRRASVRYQTKGYTRAQSHYFINILSRQRFDLSDKLILLLEDQPLISLDVEDSLSENGFRNIVTLRTRKEALTWLGEFSPDFVLLDLYLDDGDSRPILEHLSKVGTPFVVYTGSEQPPEWDAALFAAGDWVSKPGDPGLLAARIRTRLAID